MWISNFVQQDPRRPAGYLAAVTDKRRTRLHLDERRAQLLEAGLQLFQVKAYDEVSIEDIAQAVGVSKGLLYHYFGGKKAFYVACVRLAAERLVDASTPDPDLPPPLQALAGLNAYLDFVEERSGVFQALMQGGLGTDPEVAAIVDETREVFVSRVLDAAGVAVDRPVFRLAARAHIGAVEAASLAWLSAPGVPRDQLVALLVNMLGSAIAAADKTDRWRRKGAVAVRPWWYV